MQDPCAPPVLPLSLQAALSKNSDPTKRTVSVRNYGLRHFGVFHSFIPLSCSKCRLFDAPAWNTRHAMPRRIPRPLNPTSRALPFMPTFSVTPAPVSHARCYDFQVLLSGQIIVMSPSHMLQLALLYHSEAPLVLPLQDREQGTRSWSHCVRCAGMCFAAPPGSPATIQMPRDLKGREVVICGGTQVRGKC